MPVRLWRFRVPGAVPARECGMMYSGLSEEGRILELDGGEPQPLSVRAKALVFSDPVSKRMLRHLELIAPSDVPVLIKAETGTGK